MTCAIIVSIKDENKYLDEWITYHKKLGVNHIFIIDNNDIDGEDPCDIINKYNDYITYINERGNRILDFQVITYKIIYNKFKQLYDWFIFIDIDEFITLNADNNINDYLSRNIFDTVDQICLNWTIYDDNDLIYADYSIPVQKRFTRRMEYDYDKEYPLYNLQKCILRGNLNIDEHRIHNIVNFNIPFYTVNNRGDELNQLYGSSEHNEDLAYIKHYITKSLEEFIIKKYNKEDALNRGKVNFKQGYFSVNKHTAKKDEYIKNYLSSLNNDSSIKYTIITCLFGYYDTLKEPEEVDPNAEYICFTDRTDIASNVWKLINVYDNTSYNGLEKSFRLKYRNMFDYVSKDSKYIIRLDASIQIHKSLNDIIKFIDKNNYDICIMVHPERNDMIDEYNTWQSLRHQDPKYKDIFIRKMSDLNFNINHTGLIETTCQIYKNNNDVIDFVKEVGNLIEETSNFNDNNDQCYYTYVLSKYIHKFNILYTNRQIISSDYMDLCFHYGNDIVYKDHIHARGPLGEFIYDLDKNLYHTLFNDEIKIKFF